MRKSKPTESKPAPAPPIPTAPINSQAPKGKFLYREITKADLDDYLVTYFRNHPLYGKDSDLVGFANEMIDLHIDTDEISGKKANPFIKLVHSYTNVGEAGLSDETAWCASYLNFLLIICGFKGSRKGTKGHTSAAATSLGEVGEESADLVANCILVIQHLTGSLKGHYHTTQYVRRSTQDPYIIYCRGGNQGNTACLQIYDIRKEKIVHKRYNFKPLEAA